MANNREWKSKIYVLYIGEKCIDRTRFTFAFERKTNFEKHLGRKL